MRPILPVTVILLTGVCHVNSISLFPIKRESVTSNISYNSGVTTQDAGGRLADWLEGRPGGRR